jgi:hypothetical protein
LSPDLWVPGAAEPSLDGFVYRVHRQIERYTATHSADLTHVEVELGDGERLTLRALSVDAENGDSEEHIVPIGAIRRIALGPADESRRPGFALSGEIGPEPAA